MICRNELMSIKFQRQISRVIYLYVSLSQCHVVINEWLEMWLVMEILGLFVADDSFVKTEEGADVIYQGRYLTSDLLQIQPHK